MFSDGLSQCIEILDTSGFYQFPAMKELNIRLATAFILVFDLTLKDTLNSLVELKDIIMNIKGKQFVRRVHLYKYHLKKSFKKGNDKVTIILVGHKVDIINERNTDLIPKTDISEQAQELADEFFKCPYIESSAKTNINVSEIFTKIFDKIFTEQEELQEQNANTNRRNSSISFVRRFSSMSTVNNIDRSRIFSAPNVTHIVDAEGKSEMNSDGIGKNSLGILNSLRKRQTKNCVIS